MEISGQIHASAGLPQVKGSRYSLNRKLVGPQMGCVNIRKYFLPLTGIEL